MNIRQLTTQDAKVIHSLETACFTLPWSLEAFISELGSNASAVYFGVFDDGGALIGYAGMWRVADEAHITTLATRPDCRRQGVARALLDVLENRALETGASYSFLEVRVGNIAARSLYSGRGYQPLGVRRGYYADNGEDALIMKKDFCMEAADE